MRTPGRHCCVFVWMTWFGFGTLTVCDVHALMLKVSFGFFLHCDSLCVQQC